MAHHTFVIPQPNPQNASRTHTITLNTDCPRCGRAMDGLGLEPDDLFHCPHCRGALVSCARIEDGGNDRTANILTIAWAAPTDDFRDDEPCDCAGCESRAAEEGA